MDNQELGRNPEQKNGNLTIDRDATIQVMVNSNADDGEMEIDLGRVFHRMKERKRLFAWVTVLCLMVGLCAPLLMYQFQKPALTVSAVVTLDYDVNGKAVKDLTAPDGSALDLTQVTSSYVLQNALNGITLSGPVTISALRDNMKIERILTDDSRRQQEVASSMVSDKNNNAWNQVLGISLTYKNQFLVSLTNGFGEPDARTKTELEDDELRRLLNRILAAYNDYLVLTYDRVRLPEDEVSIIDPANMDLMESLDLLRTANENLITYCENQSGEVREYRSWQTGMNLGDWARKLENVNEVNISYLTSYVVSNNIVRDRDDMVTSYQYQLRNANTRLESLQQRIATVEGILKSYKNDEIFVSMQESDSSKSTSTTTDYYNSLVMEQSRNYREAAQLETQIQDLEEKLTALQGQEQTQNLEAAQAELEHTAEVMKTVYAGIVAHMEEIRENASWTNLVNATAAQGKTQSFLSANMKKMIIGAVAGLVVACGLWFVAGLLPEFHREDSKKEKEAAKA